MKIDVVIVSDGKVAKGTDFRQVTQKAIDTAKQDEGVNVIVVEGQKSVTYKDALTVHYDFPFGYNRCLNLGASKGNSKYIAFCNNDLEFTKGWTGILDTMTKYRAPSASPVDPKTAKEYGIISNGKVIKGHQVRRLFCGWCFIWERQLWVRYPHDEERIFWTADNASCYQLEKRGIKHILDTGHIVHHVQSATLDTMTAEQRERLEWDEAAKFNRAYPNKAIFQQQLKEMGK